MPAQDLQKAPVEAGKRRLDLRSIRNLEFLLGISRTTLHSVARDTEKYYSPFPQRAKVRPFQKKFPPEKKRIIDHPTEPLRTIQKRIQHRLLSSLDLPYYLCGGVKGRSLLDNVLMHLGAPVIVAVDIRNFFPSTDNQRVYSVWADLLGCSASIAALLTRLTTREHHLPKGSSTSTTLANLSLFSVDQPIREACEKASVRYSTWVDDLAFSGMRAREILPLVVETLGDAGFKISRRKVRVMGPGTRQSLNGIVIGRFPNVLQERTKQLRSGIHKLRVGEIPPKERQSYVCRLRSSIVQVASINPRTGDRLLAQLNAVIRGI